MALVGRLRLRSAVAADGRRPRAQTVSRTQLSSTLSSLRRQASRCARASLLSPPRTQAPAGRSCAAPAPCRPKSSPRPHRAPSRRNRNGSSGRRCHGPPRTSSRPCRRSRWRASLHAATEVLTCRADVADAAPVGAHAHCCPTGGGALGHPVEFIQLNKVNVSAPEVCKYCGLRFVMKKGYVASGH
jgi:hypothetical protein